MAGVDVDVDVYYAGAKGLFEWSQAWWSAIDKSLSTLSGYGDMAGSYTEAEAWATSYDKRITEVLQMVSSTATAVHNYGTILSEMGYNHALAEHAATVGTKGPAPEKPTVPQLVVLHCLIPPPSAGGPGQGLVDSGVGLLEQLGVVVPDGNSDKLDGAAQAWDRIAALEAVTKMPVAIEAVAAMFAQCTTDESAAIDEDLRALKAAVEAITTVFGELAGSCREHKDALKELRDELIAQLTGMAEAFAMEMAINVAVSLASSWVTFGVSAAVGVAAAAAIVARYARPIRAAIEAWKVRRNVAKGVRLEQDLVKHRGEVQRIEELATRRRSPVAAAGRELTQEEKFILNRGPTDRNGNDMISAIRENRVTPQMQEDINAYNRALEKLPPYEGRVVRQTHLNDDQLAKYQPGRPITEEGYTCTSTNPKGTGGGVNTGTTNVEYRITSKTGRQIGEYGGTADEVQFMDHTEFIVRDKYVDPKTGRTIIDMDEI